MNNPQFSPTKSSYSIAIGSGIFVALGGTLIMLILLYLELVGPQSVASNNLMYGGTILFISLYLLLLIGVYYTLQHAQSKHNASIHFKTSIALGCTASLSTAIFSVILTVLFYEVLYPSYNAEMKQVLIEKLQSSTREPAELEQKISEQLSYYSTVKQAKFSFSGNLLTGLLYTLLLSLFLSNPLKKK